MSHYPLDYHLAEVVITERTGVHPKSTVTIKSYVARCKCGWHGPARDSLRAADEDCYAHDSTEN